LRPPRLRLANGKITRLSELGELDAHAFCLFLSVLGKALAAQTNPDETIERQTGDGLMQIRLEPLGAHTHAKIPTNAGMFAGRDHLLTITSTKFDT
jgi:uncharacterized protein (TIGR02677 family)